MHSPELFISKERQKTRSLPLKLKKSILENESSMYVSLAPPTPNNVHCIFQQYCTFFNSLNASCSLSVPGFCPLPGTFSSRHHPIPIPLDNSNSSFRFHISLNVISSRKPSWITDTQVRYLVLIMCFPNCTTYHITLLLLIQLSIFPSIPQA